MEPHLPTQENLDFFHEKYSRPRSVAARQVERAVLGHEVGVNGYTTVEQAQALGDHLSLSAKTRLLDLGAGRGWPGSYLAQSSGCRLVATDVPFEALVEAKRYIKGRGVWEKANVVSADARALPFRPSSFDAIVHADVFC